MKRIVTLTMNPAIDKSSAVETVVSEHKLRCDEPTFEPGGGGVNVSRALNKIGATSTAVCIFGGHTGEMLKDLLARESVKFHSIQVEGATRENFTAFEKSSLLQYRFGMPGPLMLEREWKHCIQVIDEMADEMDILVLSGSLPQGVPDDFYAQLILSLKKKDVKIVVDTSGKPLREAIKAGVYMLKPNLKELEDYMDGKIEDETVCETGLMQMIHDGHAEIIVASIGAGGAILATKEGISYYRSPWVPIRSKVGAGDSMVAGLVFALAEGDSSDQIARMGVACGAAAVMTDGSELCRKEDVFQLLTKVQRTTSAGTQNPT